MYLDPDIVVNGSILDFYNQCFDKDDCEKTIVACEEVQLTKNKEVHINLGIPIDAKYFNAGVLLINLNLLRKNFDINNVVSFIKNNEAKLMFLDQDVLNAFYYDNVKYDDYHMYNLMPHNLKPSQEEMIRNAKIIHFAGPFKPWKYGYGYFGKKEYEKFIFSSGCVFWYIKSKITSMFPYYIKKLRKAKKRVSHRKK